MDRVLQRTACGATSTHRHRQVIHGWRRASPCAFTKLLALRTSFLFLLMDSVPLCLSASGIPEPGLALYGAVLNTNGSVPWLESGVVWRISGGASSVTVAATTVSINGQLFYLALVPFETRSIGGLPAFTAGSNTLELTTTSCVYTRAATVGGTNAVLQGADTFTFGPGDRGRAERLDLLVNLPRESFAQWALRTFGTTNIDMNADPLGKGMTYYEQFIAGTDPLDTKSVFRFVGIAPTSAPGSGIVVEWEGVPGRLYTVLRASGIVATSAYTQIAGPLTGTNATMQFGDPDATGPGPYFYRLQVTAP